MGTTVTPILRNTKGAPLSIAEVDSNFTAIVGKLSDKVDETAYTDSLVLTKIKNVDGTGSGLDADLFRGLSLTSLNTGSTVVARDSSGNFSASVITATFIGNVTGNVTGNVSGNVTGSLTGTATNSLSLGGVIASSYARLNSPTFTGTPTVPTASAGTNTTQIASTAFVRAAVTVATGSLGTMSTQNSNLVTITGGVISNTTINGNIVGSNSVGVRTVSTSTPSGGSNGDIWYQY
jgi:hypothetical protein